MDSFQDEGLRLAALSRYRLLPSEAEPSLDHITRLAALTCHVPAAAISIVDENCVSFKSRYGIDTRESGRAESFSTLVIAGPSVTIIPDALKDNRLTPAFLARNRGVRFCAGVPLTDPAGFRIGALKVFDKQPRRGLTDAQLHMLQELASLAVDELELQLKLRCPGSGSGQLPQTENEIRAFLEAVPQAVIAVSREGAIEVVNSRAETMFGYGAGGLAGRCIEVLIPERLHSIHREERTQFFHSPRTRPMGVGVELWARRRDGTEFPVEIGLAQMELSGRPVSVAFVTDITERKLLEDQLRQAQKLEAIGKLAGGVAHDFNNLLTVIRGNASIAVETLSAGDPLRDPLEEISEASERAAGLVRQMLSFAQKHILQPKLLDFNQHVFQTDRILKRLLGPAIELKLVLGEDVGEVQGDPVLIDQVLLNLAINARDAMPRGGRITIETSAVELNEDSANFDLTASPGPHVLLSVTDTGTGMTPEIRERIFDPFFTTKRPDRGVGLGLAAVYGSLRQIGGGILVSSEPGCGSTFEVFFPRTCEAFSRRFSPSDGRPADSNA